MMLIHSKYSESKSFKSFQVHWKQGILSIFTIQKSNDLGDTSSRCMEHAMGWELKQQNRREMQDKSRVFCDFSCSTSACRWNSTCLDKAVTQAYIMILTSSHQFQSSLYSFLGFINNLRDHLCNDTVLNSNWAN